MKISVNQKIAEGRNYFGTYKSDAGFFNCIKSIEEATNRIDCPINELKIIDIDSSNCRNIPENIFYTAKNSSGFVLKFNDQYFALRNESIANLVNRAIPGNASLQHLSKSSIQKVLNICLKEIKEDKGAKIIQLGDYAISVLSDDYRPIDAHQVFKAANKKIKKIGGEFSSGEASIDYFSCKWIINNDELVSEYKKSFDGRDWNVKPILSVTTSNTGFSAVNITPKFQNSHCEFIIGKPLSVAHKGEGSVENVSEKLENIYAIFQKSIADLNKLKDIIIAYPINTFKNVAKAIGLQKKYALLALQDFESFIDDEPIITAHDIYMGLTEAIYYGSKDTRNKRSNDDMQEIVARAITVDWSKYDLPVSDWNVSTVAN